MRPFFFDSDAALQQAAQDLRAQSTAARRLLAQSVEAQELTRKAVSEAARALEDAGFVYVREIGHVMDRDYRITPSLWGEEALEALQEGLAPA